MGLGHGIFAIHENQVLLMFPRLRDLDLAIRFGDFIGMGVSDRSDSRNRLFPTDVWCSTTLHRCE